MIIDQCFQIGKLKLQCWVEKVHPQETFKQLTVFNFLVASNYRKILRKLVVKHYENLSFRSKLTNISFKRKLQCFFNTVFTAIQCTVDKVKLQ